ncbi:hypothetical protein [Roseateles sp.]|jgi:hypothetical protein|uniref:hypothetical protein n=1 Tax=Roseateles sp. TaxID=1971397 RepID=UPI00391C1232
MKPVRRIPLLCLLLPGLLGPCLAWAAMAPAYEAQALLERLEKGSRERAAAPLSLQATVLTIERREEPGNGCPALQHVRAQVQVEGVLRGELAVGRRLTLRYTEAEYRCPGPGRSRLPELRVGQSSSLLLRCEASDCEPAAGAFSFDSDAEFERRREEARALAERYPLQRRVDVPVQRAP